MKKWFYGDEYNASKMAPATLDSALADVAEIGRELATYGGKLGEFAYSIDKIDHMAPQQLRAQCSILAWNVVIGKLSDEDVATVTKALKEACAADAYAVKELAGRFASGVKRVKVLRAIGRHPRAARFTTLCEAIEKGRFTASQWALAQKIAAEAPVE
jgi:hypothetical protein